MLQMQCIKTAFSTAPNEVGASSVQSRHHATKSFVLLHHRAYTAPLRAPLLAKQRATGLVPLISQSWHGQKAHSATARYLDHRRPISLASRQSRPCQQLGSRSVGRAAHPRCVASVSRICLIPGLILHCWPNFKRQLARRIHSRGAASRLARAEAQRREKKITVELDR